MTNEQLTQQTNSYLTITALANSTTIKFIGTGSSIYKTISVSTNNGSTWTSYTSSTSGTTIATLNTNDKLLIKGTNSTYSSATSTYNRITSDKNVDISGNIMSLIYGDNFSTQKTLSATYTFNHIFYGLKVVDASYLVLPATTLAQYCYHYMFYMCTSLVNAPELPATRLSFLCYGYMFNYCSNLINPPKLPATTLAQQCYIGMFRGCTSLTEAPKLPATTLQANCYNSMFQSCTSLVTAPDLPATSLPSGCYHYMFYGCTKLNFVRASFTTTPSTSYTNSWLYGVSSKGVFIKNSTASWDVSGDSGVPSTWISTKPNDSYFAINAIYNNTTVEFYVSSETSAQYTIEVSTDQSSWTSYNASTLGTTIANLNAGEIIYVRGEEECYAESSLYCSFNSNYPIRLFGNTMSLIYSWQFVGKTTLSISSTFKGLFSNSRVIDAADLILPATTLVNSCYREMFKGCTGLTLIPNLPATTLASCCYESMFEGCSNLNFTSYRLNATTLAIDCYKNMFKDCISLTTRAIISSSASLTTGCFSGMFKGCTSLTSTGALNYTTLAVMCYASMFEGCTSLVSAVDLPATTLVQNCYLGMFKGCTSLVSAPNLPATTLSPGCYSNMFYGCSNLNYIRASFTDTPTTAYTEDWVYGVSNTGMFIKNPEAEWDVTGTSGVPTGWTIFDSKTSPFAILGKEDNTTITFKSSSSNITKTISVSTDNGSTWTQYTSSTSGVTIATLNKNEMILIKGSNSTYSNGTIYTYFKTNSYVDILGNIMSLIYGDNFINQTTLNDTYTFYKMFSELHVWNALFLILPATTLTEGCYSYMFYNDVFMREPPRLYATTLATECCKYMFAGCTNLTTAPVLSATNLATGCYSHMFSGCTKLTTPPELPATVLAESCYNSMFENCTQLTTSPKLFAKTLVQYCYNFMFSGCTSLNDITALFTTTPSTTYTQDWVSGVASTGSFKKNSKATWDEVGTYAVPVDWTISYISIGYLAITALEDNTTISFKTVNSDSAKTISVSTDNGLTWTEYTSSTSGETIATLNTNDTVLIKGSNSTYNNNSFRTDKTVDISGNIMSLIYGDNYDGQTTLTESRVFAYLFSSLKIVDASSLILPATTLTDFCYLGMFQGCKTLVGAPQLPATTLSPGCYESMFQNCRSLVSAPQLSATTLAQYCYSDMFKYCASLVSAPQLPATTLVPYCYDGMFAYCDSLVTAPVLPAKYVPNNAYFNMFQYCHSLNFIEMHCISFEQSISTFAQYYSSLIGPTEGTFVADPTATWVNRYTVPQYWNIERKYVNIGDCNIFYVDSNRDVHNVSALYLGSIPVQMTV